MRCAGTRGASGSAGSCEQHGLTATDQQARCPLAFTPSKSDAHPGSAGGGPLTLAKDAPATRLDSFSESVRTRGDSASMPGSAARCAAALGATGGQSRDRYVPEAPCHLGRKYLLS